MLPQPMLPAIKIVERKQDSLIAELYNGKISFGEYNVAMNRVTGELADRFSGIPTSSQSQPATAQRPPEKAAALPLPAPRPTISAATPNEIRLALVIGNSNYATLPKLSNPANDARSIAEILQKMGYKTRLMLDASEQTIRGGIRQFASESSKADVAVVYYAGHGVERQ
jgi:hypothetical protein